MILADSTNTTKFEKSGVKSLFQLTEAKITKSHQELHDDGAQKMCGSTMGVSGGLSFYTSGRATSNASRPALFHTGEIRMGEQRNTI